MGYHRGGLWNCAAIAQLDDFGQEQDKDDEEDEAEASSAVIAKPWSHAITTKAEHKDQNDQKKNHVFFLRSAKIRLMRV